MFEQSPIGMALVGQDLRFQGVNGALCEMLGYTEAELTALTFPKVTHPDDVAVDADLARRVFAGRIPYYRIEKRYLRKDGDVIHISLTASVVRDKDGQPLHGIAMIEDTTQ